MVAAVEGTRPAGRRRPSRGAGEKQVLAGPTRPRGSLPDRAFAPVTTGAPRFAEKGNVVSMRPKRMHPRERSAARARWHVLASVLGPVHVNRHYTPPARAGGGGALSLASRSGKPAQAGRTGTGVDERGRCAARRASPLPQREAAWCV